MFLTSLHSYLIFCSNWYSISNDFRKPSSPFTRVRFVSSGFFFQRVISSFARSTKALNSFLKEWRLQKKTAPRTIKGTLHVKKWKLVTVTTNSNVSQTPTSKIVANAPPIIEKACAFCKYIHLRNKERIVAIVTALFDDFSAKVLHLLFLKSPFPIILGVGGQFLEWLSSSFLLLLISNPYMLTVAGPIITRKFCIF